MKSKTNILIVVIVLYLISCNEKQVVKEYYPNGMIKKEYYEIHGLFEDTFKTFHPTGNLHSLGIMKKGKRNGIQKVFYENGKLRMKGVYRDDKPNGWFYYYDESQKIDSIIEFILIKPDCPFTSYLNDSIPDSDKKSIINRYLKYDENGKIDKSNSLYFDVKLKKDTIYLGDTIFMSVVFFISERYKTKDFKIAILDPLIDKVVVVSSNDTICSYFFIPNKKGDFILKGDVIVKESWGDNYLSFGKKYFVKN